MSVRITNDVESETNCIKYKFSFVPIYKSAVLQVRIQKWYYSNRLKIYKKKNLDTNIQNENIELLQIVPHRQTFKTCLEIPYKYGPGDFRFTFAPAVYINRFFLFFPISSYPGGHD